MASSKIEKMAEEYKNKRVNSSKIHQKFT